MAEPGSTSASTSTTTGAGLDPSSAGEHFESHGHSLASWVLVAFVLVGSFVLSLAIVVTSVWLAIVGGVVLVLGLILGRVLQMAGFGVHDPAAKS